MRQTFFNVENSNMIYINNPKLLLHGFVSFLSSEKRSKYLRPRGEVKSFIKLCDKTVNCFEQTTQLVKLLTP